MDPYAVIETGGKQYRVKAGDELMIERLPGEPGAVVRLSPVLACSNGAALTVGRPAVEGAEVEAEIVEQLRGPKVVSYKKKRRKGYERKVGHRQELTRVRVRGVPAV